MFELEINGVFYKFAFNMGFMREVDKRESVPVDGIPGAKQNIGLRRVISRLLGGDINALYEILVAANFKQEPRVSGDMIDAYIDDPNTNIDELFTKVLDFLENSNATRKTYLDVKENWDMEMAKAKREAGL